MSRIVAAALVLGMLSSFGARAAESGEVVPPGASDEDTPSSAAAAPAPNATSTGKPQKRGKGLRREATKEADGTTAPNRFEADTVIKSQYTLDGKPLEVDPD